MNADPISSHQSRIINPKAWNSRIHLARPSAGTNCVHRFAGTAGERIKPGGQGRPILPAGTLNAINAFFQPHVKRVWQTTCNAAIETSGNRFQLLPVSNADSDFVIPAKAGIHFLFSRRGHKARKGFQPTTNKEQPETTNHQPRLHHRDTKTTEETLN